MGRPAKPSVVEITADGLILHFACGEKGYADRCDYDLICTSRWYVHRITSGKIKRVATFKNKRLVSLHRLIMNPPAGMVVDHADGNPLNNRRVNLRICTPLQNAGNRRVDSERMDEKGEPMPKGVTVIPSMRSRPYRAAIGNQGSSKTIGYYANKEEAARAYDRAALAKWGQFARLNFDRADYESNERVA